ncbi:MAG: hypothetical protein P8Y20_06180 [Gammaproteobacteria bacterium]|jgi:hypothetical protein
MADVTRTDNIPKPTNIAPVSKVRRKGERPKQREKSPKDSNSDDEKGNKPPKDHIDVYA